MELHSVDEKANYSAWRIVCDSALGVCIQQRVPTWSEQTFIFCGDS